ncbi:response regulator transcription factor [Reichenbachiella agarivorans]|uniref:Response regulator transcription factor n=1 Tax=Reichenbachiella agarivorans TaxID=2979464 RepID=A0ABY6CM38_9BACT|nr:response regulator transcription factor [Reichenbachiella agarivorans]UXP31566.1 response regulator transcription factor [Reichenbachiella agarivorans]
MNELKDVSIVIADDHPMMLQGLESTLNQHGLEVLAAAKDGTSALQTMIDHRPDLGIIDIDMPYLTGFAIAEECQRSGLNTKFIILSYHKEPEFIVRAKNLNISGYLLKEDTSTEIIKCIEHVLRGEFYYSRSIIHTNLENANTNVSKLNSLSPSEKKILKLIASAKSSQQIADLLHVSERTIEKHRSNIISKIGLSGQAHALSLWACEQKSVIMNL